MLGLLSRRRQVYQGSSGSPSSWLKPLNTASTTRAVLNNEGITPSPCHSIEQLSLDKNSTQPEHSDRGKCEHQAESEQEHLSQEGLESAIQSEEDLSSQHDLTSWEECGDIDLTTQTFTTQKEGGPEAEPEPEIETCSEEDSKSTDSVVPQSKYSSPDSDDSTIMATCQNTNCDDSYDSIYCQMTSDPSTSQYYIKSDGFSSIYCGSHASGGHYDEAFDESAAALSNDDDSLCLYSIDFFGDNTQNISSNSCTEAGEHTACTERDWDCDEEDTINVSCVEDQMVLEEMRSVSEIDQVVTNSEGGPKKIGEKSSENSSDYEDFEEVSDKDTEPVRSDNESEDEAESIKVKDSESEVESEGGWITEDDDSTAPQLVPNFIDNRVRSRTRSNHYSKQMYQRQYGTVSKHADDEDMHAWYESDSDSDGDFIVLKPALSSNTKYAFPKHLPTDIDDLVDFWELDFQVGSKIVPRMSCWEEKGFVPDIKDQESYERYIVYKSLYAKWVDCNRNREQWYNKYFGKTMKEVLILRQVSNKRKYTCSNKRPRSATDPPKEKRQCSLTEL